MKQTIPVFLHTQENHYDFDGTKPYIFSAFSQDMSSCGYIPLGCTNLEFDVPSREQIVAQHAVLLRAKIAEVNETASKQVRELHEQLSKLESLTYTPPQEQPHVP
jgi:hypothetical protein